MTVEEALRQAEHYAAMLAYLTDVRCEPYAAPSQAALAGLAGMCQRIEQSVRQARRTLPADALDLNLSRSSPRA